MSTTETLNIDVTVAAEAVRITAEVCPGAIPQYRAAGLCRLLLALGYTPLWVRASFRPFIGKAMSRKKFLALCREKSLMDEDIQTLDRTLRKVFRHQVRDWVNEVNSRQEVNEDAPQDLVDSMDYWGLYAKKFGANMMKVRAVQWEGRMLFLVDDIAQIYGGGYATRVGRFLAEVVNRVSPSNQADGKVQSFLHLKKLTYREILAVSASAAEDKASMKQGKWFVDEDTMLVILQQSKKPSAMAFRLHLIDVLQGRAENMVEFKQRMQENRGAVREESKELNRDLVETCRDAKASPVVIHGDINCHAYGMPRSEYKAQIQPARGVKMLDAVPTMVLARRNAITYNTIALATVAKPKNQRRLQDVVEVSAQVIQAVEFSSVEHLSEMLTRAGYPRVSL